MSTLVRRPLGLLLRLTYTRYLAASAAALAVDFGLFLTLLAGGLPAMLASGAGYSAGILAHWWLSSRTVFVGDVADRGAGRRRQQALFLGSAFAGLAITMAIVGLGAKAGLDARLAKIVASAVSFQATYLIRRRIVFG